MRSVLVVEDDPRTHELLASVLQGHGYHVAAALDGRSGLAAAQRGLPDLVVLDLGLPDISGIEVLRSLREWSTAPVLVLSATCRRGMEAEALDAGADDFLHKPFAPRELAARLRAMDRRAVAWSGTRHAELVRRFDEVEVDLRVRQLRVAGHEVRTTGTEWRLLEALTRDPGRLLTHRYLISQVWDAGHGMESRGTLRAHVRTVRAKLGRPGRGGAYLRTESGVGYRWVAPPSAVTASDLPTLLDELVSTLGTGTVGAGRLDEARALAGRALAMAGGPAVTGSQDRVRGDR